MNTNQLRLIFAGIGVGAVMTMAAVGAVFAPAVQPGTVGQEPDMTLGGTTTTTTGNTEIDTSVASPVVTAEPAPTAD